MENEFENLVSKLSAIFKTERIIEFFALLAALIFQRVFKVPFPNGLLVTIFCLFLSPFLFDPLLKRQKSTESVENVCFAYWALNITLIASVFYFIGNIWWVGVLVFISPIIHSNILLPQKKGLALVVYAAACYTSLAFLEFFMIIPHHQFFSVSEDTLHNPFYLYSSLIVILVLFPYAAYLTGSSSQILRKRTRELGDVYEKLEDAKTTLEIKVRARTEELNEINKKLEQKVMERTKELKDRIVELEKIHQITINRELKMIELKKELDKFKKEKNNKNNK